MSTPAASLPFDARPLIEPADRATVRAYVRALRQSGRAPTPNVGSRILFAVLAVVGVLFVFGTSVIGVVGRLITGADGAGFSVFAIAPLLVFVGVAGVFVWVLVRTLGSRSGERWWRLDRFARANAMEWFPSVPNPRLPGMIFGVGHGREATDVVRGERPRFVEFGNYLYRSGSGKNESTHTWGYVAVKLSTPLPHIVLDAVGNNGLFGSNLPTTFDKAQRLSLEGDFDRYFTLSCPAGYEADALYLFTPDIMERFVDQAAALDVEIVDDWLFLYSPRQASTLDPATWAWLFSVVGSLIDKFAQWERWRDDRLAATAATAAGMADAAALPFVAPTTTLRPPPGVAPQGRRLRRGIPWVTLIIVGGFVVMVVLGQLGGVLSALLR
ncbi:hypothetical protein ITJ43_10425 [Microbacterium sp. VKM Ac-2870]|uniref:hypothetical protein n=1 Tax=Microbacterium sp. VKM Ac-2870 TaxID=2783825 RepID=UPI00188BAF70|nr:hypothetical protein [Microbacterium sp. VKM Ac-2870]MBF4562559.1 hypothetical protein [Microbacterium sp. VKM Ac-2870]